VVINFVFVTVDILGVAIEFGLVIEVINGFLLEEYVIILEGDAILLEIVSEELFEFVDAIVVAVVTIIGLMVNTSPLPSRFSGIRPRMILFL
jgi:hypothetical protein